MKQREHKRPRFLAWLLCLAMVFSMLPVTALAAENEATGTLIVKTGDKEETKTGTWSIGWGLTTLKSGENGGVCLPSINLKNWDSTAAIKWSANTLPIGGEGSTVTFDFDYDSSKCSEDFSKFGIQITCGKNLWWADVTSTGAHTTKEMENASANENDPLTIMIIAFLSDGSTSESAYSGDVTISNIVLPAADIPDPTPSGDTVKITVGEVENASPSSDWSSTPTIQDGAICLDSSGFYELVWNSTPNGLKIGDSITLDAEITQGKSFTITAGLGVSRWRTNISSSGQVVLAEAGDESAAEGKADKLIFWISGSGTIKISNIVLPSAGGGDDPKPPIQGSKITIQKKVMTDQLNGDGTIEEAITGNSQKIEIPISVWDASYVEVTSAKAGEADIKDKVELHFKKEKTILTVDTSDIPEDTDVEIVVTYYYRDRPSPEDVNTVTFKGINQDTGEGMWFAPADPVEITDGEQSYQLKVDSDFHPASIVSVTNAAGEDVSGAIKCTLSGETLTLDTTGIQYSITVSVNYKYVWPGGGGGGGGGGSSPMTQRPNGNTGVSTSVTAAGTSVSAIHAESIGGVLTTEVTPDAMRDLIKQVTDSKEKTNLVTFQPNRRSSSTATSLVVQAKELAALGEKTQAGLKAESGVADITITNEAVQHLGKQDGEVAITARREQNTYTVSVTSGGTPLGEVPGGVHLNVHTPCSFSTQAYLVKEDGTEELIRWSIANQKGDAMEMNLPGSATIKFVDNPVNFQDVSAQSWGSGPIEFVASRGVFNGYGDGNFHPNDSMNRAMLVQILYNFEGNPESKMPQFTDTGSSDWFSKAIGWAESNGIASGYGNGSFGAADIVNRQDTICFLYRWMGNPAADESVLKRYLDADSISPYARQAMAWALQNGILTGDTATTITPRAQVTRYQAAKLIAGLVQHQTAWPGNETEG